MRRKSQQKETQQQSNFFFLSFPSIRLLWFLLKMSHTLYPDRHTEQASPEVTLLCLQWREEWKNLQTSCHFLSKSLESLHSRSLFLEFLFLFKHCFFVISCCCFCCYTFWLLLLLSFFSSRRCHHHHPRKVFIPCIHSIGKHTFLQMVLTSSDDDFVWGNPVINLSFLSSVIMLFFCPLNLTLFSQWIEPDWCYIGINWIP